VSGSPVRGDGLDCGGDQGELVNSAGTSAEDAQVTPAPDFRKGGAVRDRQ